MMLQNNFNHLLNELNQEQKEAVLHTNGPLLVLAGAGTGKTKVLTTRIINIIAQNLAEPSNILAVTFTNKAARQMQERVNQFISSYGLNIGTFHSIANKILRTNIHLLNNGLNSNFTIIDQDEQIKLVKDIAIINGIDTKEYKPQLLHVIISRWKDQGLLPYKLSSSDIKSAIHSLTKGIYDEYQRQLIASNAVDFGDLLLYNNELFINNPDILKKYQEYYKYILIDEYQDTNIVQYLWIRMLASLHKNICCVGDEDQSIYSWRGAEIGNIRRFSTDFPNAVIIKLEQNYRSHAYILKAASSLINNNNNRHDKSLWTTNDTGEKIKIVSCWNDKEEAQFVVSKIEEMITFNKINGSQIAILVRAGFQTRAFEEELIKYLLPYKIIGGLRFYERMEIRDVIAYIRISINNHDNLALERIINVPKRSIGNVTIKKIKDYALENKISMFNAIEEMLIKKEFSKKLYDQLSIFINSIKSWSKRYEKEEAAYVTKSILEESGYIDMLKNDKSDESRSRLENIREMLNAIADSNSINDFIEHAGLVMSNDSPEKLQEQSGDISVMTLHASKGLEFDIVFLPGWEEGIFPSQKSLSEENYKGLEEERRIAYVGITRAKQILYITFAKRRRVFHEILYTTPSRFLSEIPTDSCIQL